MITVFGNLTFVGKKKSDVKCEDITEFSKWAKKGGYVVKPTNNYYTVLKGGSTVGIINEDGTVESDSLVEDLIIEFKNR